MRSHLVVPLAVALAASGLTAAGAAPKKPVCMQVVDATGDGMAWGATKSDSVDIVSADIATGKRNLVAAMRLTSVQREALQTTGVSYIWTWTVGGVKQSVAYHVYATGETAGRFDADASTNSLSEEINVPAVADLATNTITWTVARKHVEPLKKAGAKFSGFSVRTVSGINNQISGEGRSQLATSDTAASGKTYTDLTPTCLKGT